MNSECCYSDFFIWLYKESSCTLASRYEDNDTTCSLDLDMYSNPQTNIVLRTFLIFSR